MTRKYSDENDYELLYLVSENSDDVNDMFFEKYDNIIKMKALKYKQYTESLGFDYNDLLQEGRLGLTKAINSFKDQKNVKFYTFANLCIDRQLSTFIRNISRDKHKILNDSISIDTKLPGSSKSLMDILSDEKNINPEDSFITIEEDRELLNKVISKLSKVEKEVFELRIQGFSYKEISQLLNTTEKSVSGTIGRIRGKVSKIMIKN